jgi:hypothetical protein
MQQQAAHQQQLLKAQHYHAFMVQLRVLQHWRQHAQQRRYKRVLQDR